MKNYINLGLADLRDIGPQRVDNLNHLHFIMECVLGSAALNAAIGDKDMESYKEGVKFLEFLMQDEWGFGRDDSRHTHCKRLASVTKERVFT